MKKNSLFKKEYNKANMIDIKSDLDIYDECKFSYLDVLKEKEVEVVSKVYSECKCTKSVNFGIYYNKCEKCDGKGKLVLNGNEVVCNHCRGLGRVVKENCPLCDGEGRVIRKGKVLVKLNNKLKEDDYVVIKGMGKISDEIKGDLFIKVKIKDKECFEIINNDVYDRRLIRVNKEELNKGVSKKIETVKDFVEIKPRGELEKEVVRLEGHGLNGGDFYACFDNELTPIKGKDVYKNVIVNKYMLSFYVNYNEINSDKKCLNISYYKKLNDLSSEYIDLKEANNFKIIKLKEKGINGKNGGARGDLYLRVFFDDEFVCVGDKLYHKPIKLNKYEANDGKKVVEFNKEKINLSFPKGISTLYDVWVENCGFMTSKNEFDGAIFVVNPYEYDVYSVSVNVSKKDKVIYLKDYKKYFNEIVKCNYTHGLKVNLSKKGNSEVWDNEGNKVIVNVIK